MQEPAPFSSLQSAFAPQGDGLHGCRFSSTGGAVKQTGQVIFIFKCVKK